MAAVHVYASASIWLLKVMEQKVVIHTHKPTLIVFALSLHCMMSKRHYGYND